MIVSQEVYAVFYGSTQTVFHFGTEKQEVFHQQQWLLTTEILVRYMLPGHRIWMAGMSTVV